MAGVSPSLPSFPVFVDNIHGDVQIKDLRGLFSRHGRVEEVTIVSSHGFVNFSCADEAVKAIERLHGYRFFGKKLSVELSKELSEFIDRRQRLARRRRSSEYSDHHLHRSRSRSRDHDQVNRRVAKKNHRHETTRKVRVEINESSIEKSPHDLREVLLQKKNKAIIEDDANMDTEETAADHNVQELYIGNLINAVEKVDLEQLLESYGPIKDVQIFPDHAIVTVQCSQEAANEAIETLDQNHWLDNDILVKFNQEPVAVKNPTTIVKTVINELASQQTGAGCDKTHELWIWSSILNEDTFLDDMTALVCQYGHIESKRWRLEASESISIELNCSEEKVIECIQDLNGRPYKSDSFIRIKFPDKCADESKLSSKIPNYPYQLMPTSIIPSKMPSNKSNNTKEKKIREIWIWSPAPNKKSFLEDMSSVVSQFGKVKSQCWLKNGQGAINIKLNSSEKQAVRCISETIGIQYKAHEIRIKFADGSLEDSLHKEPQYSIQLRRYPKQLIPDEFKKVERKSSTEAIIGVLPSSSSLGAFAVIPDKAAMTSIIRNARSSFDQEDDQQQPPRGEKNSLIGPPQLALNDAAFITSIEGTIHSVSNKLILISFRLASGRKVRMARLKPGHMFVDGKKSLGYLTKNKNFHEWPQAIKSWLQIGSSVMLDVQRLSEVEVEDMRDLTGESVMYETPLIWKQNSPRPLERLNLTATTVAMKATVIKLYPKWALLQPLQLNGGEKLILLQIKQFFVPEEDTKIQSLLSHIEVGDTLAVLAESSEYLLMAEIARGLPFFDERTDNLKYEAVLAWHLVSEVDPYAVELRKSRTEADDNGETTFMASSSTLCYPLPPEKEAQYRKWKGVIEELHIPSGGIIRLTEATASNWQEDRQRVYFHRSRLYVNGVRMSSNSALDEELVVGDIVTVDVAMNRFDMTSAYISGTEAFWIGLAVRVNTVDRGQCLANKLRAEVFKGRQQEGGYHKIQQKTCQKINDENNCQKLTQKLFSVYCRESMRQLMLQRYAKVGWCTSRGPRPVRP
jgi:RNA recognition motif-containing protein